MCILKSSIIWILEFSSFYISAIVDSRSNVLQLSKIIIYFKDFNNNKDCNFIKSNLNAKLYTIMLKTIIIIIKIYVKLLQK